MRGGAISYPGFGARCPLVLAGCAVEQTNLMTAIAKLVLAGERAGFTVEQMIQLLQTAPA